MKIGYTLVLVLLAVVLSCKPVPQAEPEPVPASQINVDELLADYKGGEWITNHEAALKFSKDLSRPILINFTGSDWCSWCIKLNKEVFTQEEFTAYAKENLILLKLDFPRRIAQSAEEKAQNMKLQEQYKISGYPTIIMTDATGKEIGRTGYQPGGAGAYVKHLQAILASK